MVGTNVIHVMIRASYDSEEISRQRLELSEATCLKCLSHQELKPVICLGLNEHDPYHDERLCLFKETGCEIRTFYSNQHWKASSFGRGWRTVARLDDDDIIDVKFYSSMAQSALAIISS